MNITMLDRLRPFLSKILAAALVPLFVWLGAKTGFVGFLDPALAENVANFAAMWLTFTVGHTLISKKTNPGNTASAHLAKAEADKAVELKAEGNTYTVSRTDDGAVG